MLVNALFLGSFMALIYNNRFLTRTENDGINSSLDLSPPDYTRETRSIDDRSCSMLLP